MLNTGKWSIQFWSIGLDIEFVGAVRDTMNGSVISVETYFFVQVHKRPLC